jgi:HSP20 family protein
MFVTRDPWAMVASLRREMDDLLGGSNGVRHRPSHSFPALNIWEDASHLYAEAEVPGLSMENVEVLVEGNELTVKGRREACGDESCTFHRRERGAGEFSRTVQLPVQIDADKVEAKLAEGVLTITLPKAEAAKARKIKVTAS